MLLSPRRLIQSAIIIRPSTLLSFHKALVKRNTYNSLDYNDACERHSERNRAMLLFTHLCGMRIGEVVALRVSDVIDDNGEVKGELRLCAEQTKGSRARVVFVPMRMHKEIKRYVEH